MNNNIVKVPYIDNLPINDFDRLEEIMELHASKIFISNINWPDEFPYLPSTAALVARNNTHMVVMYHVRGLDIRASEMTDNEMVCADSCCEFFVSDPIDGTYYNFEVNCIGTLKAAKRKSRQDYKLFNLDELSKVIRHTSLERKEARLTGIHSWRVAMCIPFDLIGFTSDTVPHRLAANFYKCADKSDHPHYVSWNPINTEHPDFHRPECFGILELQ